MSNSRPDSGSNRREFVTALAGGSALLAGRGAFQLGSPTGYKFYRVLTAGDPNFQPSIQTMTAAVMMGSSSGKPGVETIYLHGTQLPPAGSSDPIPTAFQLLINYSFTPPRVTGGGVIASQGSTIIPIGEPSFIVGRLGTGASNSQRNYVTTVFPEDSTTAASPANSPGIFLWEFGSQTWRRVVRFGDPSPDGGFYGADFGDVAIDNNGNITFVAATTANPSLGFARYFMGSQTLICAEGGSGQDCRVLLKTGDLAAFSALAIQSFGLVTVASDNNAFAVQVSAKRLDRRASSSGTALVTGRTDRRALDYRLVAASQRLLFAAEAHSRNAVMGDVFLGARVNSSDEVVFVTHSPQFEPSLGSDDIQSLGSYSRGRSSILSQSHAVAAATTDDVVAYGSPLLGDNGSKYVTESLADGSTQLKLIDQSNNEQVLLKSGDRVQGSTASDTKKITEILCGYHPTQVDDFGRLAFVAEFLKSDGANPQDPNNIETALVIAIPQ